MNGGRRFWRFSAVGAIGIGVQLAVLATLIAFNINYLLATAFAVEAAVLHNFIWHRNFTWADRDSDSWFKRLLRLHFSNGFISLVGNMFIMRVLVGRFQISVIVANVITISMCFCANFLASDRWVFASPFLFESPYSLAHQNQRSLREGNINEGRSDA